MNPIKIPVFYWKANGHIPHTFIYDDDELGTHVWGIPELEYKGLVKVRIFKWLNLVMKPKTLFIKVRKFLKEIVVSSVQNKTNKKPAKIFTQFLP